MGDAEKTFKKVLAVFARDKKIKVIKKSSLYKTEPVGVREQPFFTNAVLEIKTKLTPKELLKYVKAVETACGRKERDKWQPREIDIDILLYGDKIIKTKKLTIPHPRLHKRRFALAPLAEIAKEVAHPVLMKSIEEILKSCDDNSRVERIAKAR